MTTWIPTRPGRGIAFVLGCSLLALLVVLGAGSRRAAAAGDWWDTSWHFRVLLMVDANGHDRSDKVADVDINFASLMAAHDYTGELDPKSIRVIEVDGVNAVLDAAVPFQYEAGANPSAGTLTFLMAGNTAAHQTRRYHVYFNPTGGSFTAPTFTNRITLTDNATDQGFASYKLVGSNATWFYHKKGGGFSGLEDAQGNDWISWNATAADKGDYRGIPNLVHPNDGGYFHPGRTTANSIIAAEGPLKVGIVSTAPGWQTRWDIYPDYATMTVLAKPATTRYWFQYEGTPGGALNTTDRVVRPNGSDISAVNNSFTQDIPGDEWVYMYDPQVGTTGRSFFMAHHQQNTHVDSYWPLGSMTILAFGRNDANGRYLNAVGERFTIGLTNGTALEGVRSVVFNAAQPLLTTVGPSEKEGDPPPPLSRGAFYLSTPAAGRIELGAVDLVFGDEDVIRFDDATNTWSLVFDGSAAGLPGAADVDGFALDGADFLLSFDAPIVVPGISGTTDDSDIVRYTPGVGFSMVHDMSMSTHGLTTSDEDVDAIALDASNQLLVSTLGSFSVPGAGTGRDEDLLLWTGSTWQLAFDGSHNAGLATEDIAGVAIDRATGDIYLTILGAFALPGVGSGNGADVVRCAAPILGPLTTSCAYTAYADFAPFGITQIDAFDLVLPVD